MNETDYKSVPPKKVINGTISIHKAALKAKSPEELQDQSRTWVLANIEEGLGRVSAMKGWDAGYRAKEKEQVEFVSLVREAFKEYGWTGPHVRYEEDMMFPLECGIDFPKCAMCQLKDKLESME